MEISKMYFMMFLIIYIIVFIYYIKLLNKLFL